MRAVLPSSSVLLTLYTQKPTIVLSPSGLSRILSGKIAELALGYGGSVGTLKSMGAIEMGLAEEELQPLVDSWRAANPNIVKFWWNVDCAVKTAVKQKK